MFTQTQLNSINPKRYKIITANSQNVMIESKRTGHYWQIHTASDPERRSCIVFHKHRKGDPYHCHCRAQNLYHALAKIRAHDLWQLDGRLRSGRKHGRDKY